MDFLQQLNIKTENAGTSTGSKSICGKAEKIDSYSPVDGKLIGSVWATSKEDYDKTLKTAQQAFLEWRKFPAPNVGRLYASLVKPCGNIKNRWVNW
jgi:aldehyde dehydrogenase (NAD+)